MEPEATYGKRLHKAARKDFKSFWSAHRWWSALISLISAGAGVLIQMAILGTGSVVNLALTLSIALGFLLLSLIGNYLISLRRAAEALDTGLREEIRTKESALLELSKDNLTLRQRLDNPPLSPVEQSRRDLVKQELEAFPASHSAVATAIMKYILQYGEVDSISVVSGGVLGPISNPYLSQDVIQRAVSNGLLKADGPSRRLLRVNPELKSALAFHLLGD